MANALGVGHQIEFEGKTYTLAPFSFRLIAHFEQWVKQMAWAEVEEDRILVEQGVISPDVYQARHAEISSLIASKQHRKGGKLFAGMLGTIAGQIRMAYLMLWDNDKSVTPAMVERLFEQRFTELMSRIKDMVEDPNLKTGEAKTSPSTPSVPSSPTGA